MKCPPCVEAGLTSRLDQVREDVWPGRTIKYWDEDGNTHIHCGTVTSRAYRCSQGHEWDHHGRTGCPTCGVPVDPKEIQN